MEQVKARVAVLVVATACLVGMAVGSALTFAFLSSQKAIPSTGLIAAIDVGVFSDASCTQNLTSINSGNVYPGDSVRRLIYVKNTGNVPVTLSLTTNAWNPSIAEGQLAVGWDNEGTSLNPSGSTAAALTLTVSPAVHDVVSFTVNVIITGSG